MSKSRLGKRERKARNRRMSMRKTGHTMIMSHCDLCSKPDTWKFGPSKSNKIGLCPKKLVCGQCRSGNKTCASDQVVGS